MNGASAGAAAVAAALTLLVGCTSSKPPAADRSPGAPATPSRATPGFTTCGSFGLRATTGSATIPLLSCAGLADPSPLPSIRVRVGGVVAITGAHGQEHLVLHGGDAVVIDGLHVTARRAGSTIVTVSGWSCFELMGPPPKACPLLQLTVDG